MPHARKRHAVQSILKKLSFTRVLAIQGARQTGKSFLVRHLLHPSLKKLVYKTFDEILVRKFAETNPDTFLDQHASAHPLAIDEAQKVPDIFDAVKLEVDEDPRPGRYILLGSTEFSKMSRIRESLTGRMGRVRLYPLNVAESLKLGPNTGPAISLIQPHTRVDRKDFLRYLSLGGMPGIFAVRSEEMRKQFQEDWISLTVERDALSFPKVSIDADLCRAILKQVAILEEPNAANLCKATRTKPKTFQRHLKVLMNLFVLHRLDPHPLGTGKSLYFICDVGIANALGASFEKSLYTWLIQEQLSQRSYRQDIDHQLYFYRNTKGSLVHLIVQSSHPRAGSGFAAIKLFSEERFDLREAEVLWGLMKKAKDVVKANDLQLLGLGPSEIVIPASERGHRLHISPWEAIC